MRALHAHSPPMVLPIGVEYDRHLYEVTPDDANIIYHGTSLSNVDSILQQGLDPHCPFWLAARILYRCDPGTQFAQLPAVE